MSDCGGPARRAEAVHAADAVCDRIDIQPHQRLKLERLCRYVSRPPVSVDRMTLTASGQVRYTL
ncbi:MAG: transposase [Gammaproteobacteria bacterium]|nr:transposase [Gammaproteobacteria bacterium]